MRKEMKYDFLRLRRDKFKLEEEEEENAIM